MSWPMAWSTRLSCCSSKTPSGCLQPTTRASSTYWVTHTQTRGQKSSLIVSQPLPCRLFSAADPVSCWWGHHLTGSDAGGWSWGRCWCCRQSSDSLLLVCVRVYLCVSLDLSSGTELALQLESRWFETNSAEPSSKVFVKLILMLLFFVMIMMKTSLVLLFKSPENSKCATCISSRTW